ncbi:site-specific recombinase XerD [Paenibacillus castaneae]|nr:site-specific recombinase XerD [Paenibacillus castaneae]
MLNYAAAECGLEEIGTHTLRKTFGYHFYQKTKDVAMLQNIFNHAYPSLTLRYIGINQDMIDDAVSKFTL